MSCATLSKTPIVNNTWVQQGTHLDLVGAYTAKMRETDSDLIGRSRVFVDTLEGALSEAGDLIQAANEGPWAFGDICGTLSDLASKHIEGRVSSDEITIFKSVGSALEDLAAARLAFERESVT